MQKAGEKVLLIIWSRRNFSSIQKVHRSGILLLQGSGKITKLFDVLFLFEQLPVF